MSNLYQYNGKEWVEIGKDGSPDKRIQIVEKINKGKKDDTKIELSQIESFDKIHTKLSDDLINRAIGIVDSRTSFLINKVSNLKIQVETLEASEGNWGQIGGTLSSQTDLQTALNGKADDLAGTINEIAYFNTASTIASLPVATYPSLTELSYVKGVTSAIQTQLGLKAPLTSPVFVTDITTPLIIGGTAVGSNIIYKSTTGAGTVAGIAHQWTGGTDGATVIATMLNNGNVGIGTTAPGYLLDVNGNARIKGVGSSLLFDTTGAEANASIKVTNDYWLTLKTSRGSTSQIDLADDSLRFSTGSERMRILANGNVGIGTTSPAYKLEVNGSIKIDTGSLYFADGTSLSSNTIAGGAAGYSSNSDINITADADNNASGAINLITGVTNRLTILNNGNVGIGTASPTHKITLYGVGGSDTGGGLLGMTITDDESFSWASESLNPNLTAGNNVIHMIGKASNANNESYFGFHYVGAGSSSNFATIGLYGSDNLVNILGNGNVGIGTTSPGAKLEVAGTTGLTWGYTTTANTILGDKAGSSLFVATPGYGGSWSSGFGVDGTIESANGTSIIRLGAYGTNSASGFGSSLAFITTKDTVATERMRINKDGNVGIGTTAPDTYSYGGTRKFLTVRNTDTSGEPFFQLIANGTGNSIIDFGNESIRRASIIGFNGSDLAFFTNSTNSGTDATEKMRILSNGNVGIGTTTPGNILTIQQTSATDPVADAWTVYSSGRWKEHRVPIVNALETINELNPVYFDWKAEYGGAHDLGFIAEEVGVIIPEVVAWEDNGIDAKSIDYARLSTIAIAGVKEMNLKLENINTFETDEEGISIINSFRDNITAWLANMGNNITDLYASVIHSDKVDTKMLCVGDTCVTEDEFLEIVNKNVTTDVENNNQPAEKTTDEKLLEAETAAGLLSPDSYTNYSIVTEALALSEETEENKLFKITAINDAVAGLVLKEEGNQQPPALTVEQLAAQEEARLAEIAEAERLAAEQAALESAGQQQTPPQQE